MTDQRRAIVFALSAVLLWSTVATAFKLSLQYLSPIELLLYATVFAVLVLGATLVCQGKFSLVFGGSRRDYLRSIVLGFLSPFLYYLVLFEAYDLLPAQQAQPINYIWAIVLALLSVPLLKQKVRPVQWLALLVSFAGVVVISTEGDPLSLQFTNALGVVLALASTVILALYWIYNTRNHRDPVVGLFLNFLCALPFILGYYLMVEGYRAVSMQGILGAAYVGTIEMGFGFVLWLTAMKLTNNTARISNLIFLSPFLSLVFIHFVLEEHIVAGTYIGLVLIITGIFIQNYKRPVA